ncbi:MAG: LytTR family transcriptional regulator [Bifidobacteriaceae bacterium]|jgi:DNA-binding LytR/AlgR family response regulator|nr:LytTR family transcriptional regulator [Bifidobacteriaceae bacterium]MCI1914938.1 LytTR family transcriptional regulator [Bifidobacteriaceae bacterium]
MHVEFRQEPESTEPHAVIIAAERTARIDDLIKKLESIDTRTMIEARLSGKSALLKITDILAFRAHDKKVFARYGNYDWTVTETLTALTNKLPEASFIRISNNGIINMRHLRRFDLNSAGAYIAILSDGTTIKVTASYIRTIRERLVTS